MCLIEKEDCEFSKNKNRSNGRNSYCKECKKKYNKDNKDKQRQSKLIYRKNNLERLNNAHSAYLIEHVEEIRKKTKEYYEKHKTEINARTIKNMNYRLENDPYFKFTHTLRLRIRSAINAQANKRKSKSCAEYGIDFKKIYDRIGPRPNKSYQLDHIIPLNIFDLNNVDHVKLAHTPNNLRWVPAEENLKKNKKICFDLINNDPVLVEIYHNITNQQM